MLLRNSEPTVEPVDITLLRSPCSMTRSVNFMSDFVDNRDEVFALFGAIQAKRMFGGFGVYHDRKNKCQR